MKENVAGSPPPANGLCTSKPHLPPSPFPLLPDPLSAALPPPATPPLGMCCACPYLLLSFVEDADTFSSLLLKALRKGVRKGREKRKGSGGGLGKTTTSRTRTTRKNKMKRVLSGQEKNKERKKAYIKVERQESNKLQGAAKS